MFRCLSSSSSLLTKTRIISVTATATATATTSTQLRRLSLLHRKEKKLEAVSTLNELRRMTPHDVEKELGKSTRNLSLLFSLAEYEKAIECAEDIQQKIATIMGVDNVMYASILNNLALAQKNCGKIEEAIPNYEQAAQTYHEIVGENHHSFATAVGNLGIAYKCFAEQSTGLNKDQFFHKAEDTLTLAYKIRQQINASPQDIISSRNFLASLHTSRKRFEEALKLLRESLEQAKAVFGFNHLITATTFNNLGFTLKMQNNINGLDEAEECYQHAITIRSDLLGERHVDTIVAMNNLAELLLLRGETVRATELQETILERVGATSETPLC